MYKCLECGKIFDDGEEKTYFETHGDTELNAESWIGCPKCGGVFDNVKECPVCGRLLTEDESYSGFCVECLEKLISYQTALMYFKHRDSIVDFMIGKFYGSDVPINQSDKLKSAMENMYNRMMANDILCEETEFITSIKEYILTDEGDFGKRDFAEFIKESTKHDRT